MPSLKTLTSELSVGFGIVGVSDPTESSLNIETLFDETLDEVTYQRFVTEYSSNTRLYSRLVQCGLNLRQTAFPKAAQVRWTGSEQQPASVTVAKDLYVPVYNTYISIKVNSHVAANPSPFNLFRNLPQGLAFTSVSPDWYLETNPDGLQEVYAAAARNYPEELPGTIQEFYETVKRDDRRPFQKYINEEMTPEDEAVFNKIYRRFNYRVAEVSANEFNHHISQLPTNRRNAVYEGIIQRFFRINSTPYYLTGIDRGRLFGVKIPDIARWKRDWRLVRINASPNKNSKQSEVNFGMEVQNRSTRVSTPLPFHAEVRFSHGKFCGNPESKLYKEFRWSEVPFFETCF